MTTYHLLLAVHLVLAVFAVGPLVHAATTASRGMRTGDGAACESASRVLRIYAYASVLVVLVGIPLMMQKPYGPRRLGEFGQTWIWLSLVLWVLAIGLVLGLIVPSLDRAGKQLAAGEPAGSLTARVAAGGGVVALAFVAVVVLMVYRPGQ